MEFDLNKDGIKTTYTLEDGLTLADMTGWLHEGGNAYSLNDKFKQKEIANVNEYLDKAVGKRVWIRIFVLDD